MYLGNDNDLIQGKGIGNHLDINNCSAVNRDLLCLITYIAEHEDSVCGEIAEGIPAFSICVCSDFP